MDLPQSDPALPIAATLPALRAALAEGNALLVAPPGAGKTTLVPLSLLDEPWRTHSRIVMLEPRRLAARAAATRMAALLGEPVGERIGYRTRVDSAVSARTVIEVVTEGLLVARLLSDPTLDGVGLVIFDELHERTLDGELALAFCLDLQRSRPELRLLAMSATADVAAVKEAMGGPAVVRSEGRIHPVRISHAKRDIEHPRDLPDALARAILATLPDTGGDILAFLPGKAEIARAAALLTDTRATVLALHGEMRPEDQAPILQPPLPGQRRVILATSIAETSLTVPGVRTVIDGGWRRAPRLDPGRGLARLATLRISRAAADQRAGRAGREAPGRCLRLWTAAAHRALPPFDRPEILDSELAAFRLATACWQSAWGTPPEALRFADRPPAGALDAASTLLAGLGALDEHGLPTPAGERMARLGTHPRLAAMMLAAADDGQASLAADLAALLEERDPLASRGAPTPHADVGSRLFAIHADGGGDRATLARIRQAAARFRRRLGTGATTPAGDPAALLAAAFPDRIAQRRSSGRDDAGSFRMSGGGSASLPPTDPLARAPLLVAAGLHLGRGAARVTLAAPLDPENLPDALLARTTEAVERGVDPRTGAVFNRRRLRLGALVLSDRLVPAPPEEIASALATEAAPRLAALLDWTEQARNLQSRTILARTHLGLDLPDLSDQALASDPQVLVPALARAGAARLADLARLDLAAALRNLIPARARAELDRLLPTHITLPNGPARIDYAADTPTASARAQAFYGLDRTPTLAGGGIALTIALLSPAGRPIALTRDLPGFWRGGWRDARSAMRGRYPRHHWPEEPWHPPTADGQKARTPNR